MGRPLPAPQESPVISRLQRRSRNGKGKGTERQGVFLTGDKNLPDVHTAARPGEDRLPHLPRVRVKPEEKAAPAGKAGGSGSPARLKRGRRQPEEPSPQGLPQPEPSRRPQPGPALLTAPGGRLKLAGGPEPPRAGGAGVAGWRRSLLSARPGSEQSGIGGAARRSAQLRPLPLSLPPSLQCGPRRGAGFNHLLRGASSKGCRLPGRGAPCRGGGEREETPLGPRRPLSVAQRAEGPRRCPPLLPLSPQARRCLPPSPRCPSLPTAAVRSPHLFPCRVGASPQCPAMAVG